MRRKILHFLTAYYLIIRVVQCFVPACTPPRGCLGAHVDDSTVSPATWMYDDIPSEFAPLLTTVAETCLPRAAKTGKQAHDEFRYEWGTWVNEEKLELLMDRVNEVRLRSGAYEKLKMEDSPVRYRIAGGQDWDILVHVLPEGREWRGIWPTGSWAILKPLTGVIEVAMLRGPNAQGLYRKATTKSLRGGGDGTLAGSKATAGDNCIKYVGGPLRSYAGKAAKPILLEVVIRPPIFADENNDDSLEDLPIVMEEVLAIEIPSDEVKDEEEETDEEDSSNSSGESLSSKIGMKFDQVGGLDDQLNDIARRVLASRANPEAARRLGISHVKGILLSGPPGCGKTLLARELARLLGAREPQIVNGPEILDKYIGEAEKRVRGKWGFPAWSVGLLNHLLTPATYFISWFSISKQPCFCQPSKSTPRWETIQRYT